MTVVLLPVMRVALKLAQATAEELMQAGVPDYPQPDTLLDEFESAASLHGEYNIIR